MLFTNPFRVVAVSIQFWMMSLLASLQPANGDPIAAKPVDLRCDHKADSTQLGSFLPQFGWRLQTEDRGYMQAGYQILVGTSQDNLEPGTGDLWDSGEVQAGKSEFVEYQGRMLGQGQKFYWKVRVKDRAGNWTQWSDTAETLVKWPDVAEMDELTWSPKDSGASTFITSDPNLSALYLKSQALMSGKTSLAELSHILRVANHHYDLSRSVKPLLRERCLGIDESGLYLDTNASSDEPSPDLTGRLVFAVFSYWWSTGDLAFLQRHWSALFSNLMKTYGILHHDSRVNWNAVASGFMPENDAIPARDACLMRHAIALRLMIEMARYCSQNPYETKILLAQQEELIKQLRVALLDESGSFKHSSITGLVMAFRSGLFQDSEKLDANKKVLVDLLRAEKAPVLGSNDYLTMNLLPLLGALGEPQLAFELASKSVDQQSSRMTTFGVSDWLMASVAGIEALDPGFTSFRVTPGLVFREKLEHVKAEFPGSRGRIKTHWYVSGKGFGFEISVPPNSIALVTLPKAENAEILESGRPLTDQKFIFGIKDKGDSIEFRVAPGSYHFKSE